MKRRRLLLLSHFFPPLAGGGVHRALAFVQYLPQHGWDCTVIAGGEQDFWIRDPSLLARVPAATEVIRIAGASALAAWLRMLRGGRARLDQRRAAAFAPARRLADWWLLPDPYRGWARRAEQVAAERVARGDIDAILTTSPPDSAHLAGLALASRPGRRVPWVADFRDPWIGLSFRTPPTAWHRGRHERMERAVLTGADLVLTASRTHHESVTRRAGSPRRAVWLPNGYEPAPPAAVPPVDDGMFRLAFTGSMADMADTQTALEGVAELLTRHPAARRRVRLDIVGPFNADDADRALALGLQGIATFHGARPHAEARALQRRADVLLLWKPRGPGYATMVPGKLYEYLDARRPIVAIVDPGDEVARLVEQGGGMVIPPGDAAAVASALERLGAAVAGARPAPLARPDWLDEHARPRLAARLAAELDSLIGSTA